MSEKETVVAEHVRSVLLTGEARLYDQVSASFTWVLGTLFASNGGALVAILSTVSSSNRPPAAPLGFFAVGVVFSILMGIWNAVYAAKAIIPMTDLRMTMTLIDAGHANPEELDRKMSALEGFDWIKRFLYGSGAVSFISLILGMVAFGYGMVRA